MTGCPSVAARAGAGLDLGECEAGSRHILNIALAAPAEGSCGAVLAVLLAEAGAAPSADPGPATRCVHVAGMSCGTVQRRFVGRCSKVVAMLRRISRTGSLRLFMLSYPVINHWCILWAVPALDSFQQSVLMPFGGMQCR